MSFLFTHGNDPRRESRRITIGLVGLAVVTVILLNFGIYQSAQRSLVQQRWDQLAASTDTKRDQIRALFQGFERQTRYVAEQSAVTAWTLAALNGTLTPDDQHQFQLELERAARTFGFQSLRVVTPGGQELARTAIGGELETAEHAKLAQRAAQTRGNLVVDIHAEPGGEHAIEIGMPLVASARDGIVPVLISTANPDEALRNLLSSWPGFGAGATAYLVRREAGRVVYLTTAEPRGAGAIKPPVPMTEKTARAASMAAAGVESNLELTDEHGRPVCATSRFLPELGWGLVGEMDRNVMMAGMRGTAIKLFVIDLLIVVGALLLAWLWRRQYVTGIARHEEEVTSRHAARVQAIFDTAFDAILTFDRNGQVRTVNRAAENLFGRGATEMDGQPLHRFLHWGSGPSSQAGRQDLPTPGVVIVAEALKADGERFPAEFSLGQAGDGDDLLYTAIVRDIRERVEAERRIRAFAEGLEMSNCRLEEVNAQLEEASRLKSEFLANTSHELRTPLNGMIGFLQLVLDGMCESKEEERDFIKQALQCSRHLLGLINDVLDIAKIEAGKLTLEIAKVDVEQLFQEVHTVTHVQAAQKGITLRFETPENAGHFAHCDFSKTKQILINLIGNSIKFTPKGMVTVRATPHPQLGHFMFEVVDTGIGIPKDQQHVIFEKFAQGDGSTTRKYGGTGLGLAISQSLVEVMGGVIGVQSDGPGRGTRMYFSLPIWTEGREVPLAADETAAEQIQGPPGGPLVLVVEDDPVFRQFVVALLHRSGYRSVEASNAEAAWVLVRRLNPGVVVLDYALTCAEGASLRTGWDLAERMTIDGSTRHIPLVFVTGFELELREKLRSTAFGRKSEHLMKPIEGAALISKIEELVEVTNGRLVRVLMADDDPSVAAFVRKVLPESRFHLELATNGEECLHILRTQPRGFDLLLLDLMMPEVSGYDVLREMTLTGTAPSLPVLVLTNFPDARNADEKRLLEQGLVLDVIAKTAVHDNPQLLPHVLDWHLQAAEEEEEREVA